MVIPPVLLMFPQDILTIQGLWYFHINLSFFPPPPVSVKNVLIVFIGIEWFLQISLGQTFIFTIRILPFLEHRKIFLLLVFPWPLDQFIFFCNNKSPLLKDSKKRELSLAYHSRGMKGHYGGLEA